MTSYSLEDYKDRELIETQKDITSFSQPVDLEVDQRYLPSDLHKKIPKQGNFVFIKSPVGSGKSSTLKNIADIFKAQKKPVLGLVPRIALGLKWISDVKDINKEKNIKLCADSLRKIKDMDVTGALIAIDEVELLLKHLMTSNTCAEWRTELLKIFEQKIRQCLSTGGIAVLLDADLSNNTIKYFQSLAPAAKTFTVFNKAHSIRSKIRIHLGKKDKTIEQIIRALKEGKKVSVATDSRKEAEALEAIIKEELPKKYIKNINSNTTRNKETKEWMRDISNNIKKDKIDLLIYTPSMGVGIDINIDYFDVVFGIFFGVLTTSEILQAMFRVRAEIPREIYVADKGIPDSDSLSFHPSKILKEENYAFLSDEKLIDY